MPQFILNKQEYDGHHEVHNADAHCNSDTYPNDDNQIDLEWHANCSDAISEAEDDYPYWDIDGCAFCTDCHTK